MRVYDITLREVGTHAQRRPPRPRLHRAQPPRMQSARFQAQGLYAGSGVVEVGCKTVGSQRFLSRTCSGSSEGQRPARLVQLPSQRETKTSRNIASTSPEVEISIALYTRQVVARPLSRPVLDCRVIGRRGGVQRQAEVQVSRRLQSERRREG